ncbi:hypothetical protein N7326_03405 [Corynebacterium sp. ES2794-CONJ1]|uniref:hypothetical protein n=1 Tax=Corynebacterium sp. ES2794-CONJ1 TaxID=2980553 RepID=UPI0021D80366|nr:hypothetical protein [Corynebacterium sp. ES2794-CONJ1]MCU9518923.1 hypothetical protein [Corynebacterium sp. ES2794-CONJ1]
MSKLVNLTPHPVTLLDQDSGAKSELPGAKEPARVVERSGSAGLLTYEGLTIRSYLVSPTREVTNLPEFQEGVVYVVSRMVCEALPERSDLLFPFILERDAENYVIGCSALGKIG